MKLGPIRKFPELWDYNWCAAHEHYGPAWIAKELGARRDYVIHRMRLLGFVFVKGAVPDWHPVETSVAERFYPEWPAALVASALARTLHSVHHYASDHNVRRVGRIGPVARHQETFWPEWRGYVRENVGEWLSNGCRDVALKFTWRPAQPPGPNQGCRLCELEGCGHDVNPLPCERVSVEDWLRGEGK